MYPLGTLKSERDTNLSYYLKREGEYLNMNQAKAAAQAKYPVSKVIHSAITIFLMFLFGRVIPPFGGITEVGMNVLGVFLGVIYGYCTCEIAWPSILGFVAYGLSGAVTMKEGIQAMMGQSVVFQSICAFLAAGALSEFGFSKWFVRWSLSPEGVQGQADRLHLVLPGHLRPFRRRDLHGPSAGPAVCSLGGYCGKLRL